MSEHERVRNDTLRNGNGPDERSRAGWAKEGRALMHGEADDVLHAQGEQRELVTHATRGDPGVILRARATTQLCSHRKTSPCTGDLLVLRQHARAAIQSSS